MSTRTTKRTPPPAASPEAERAALACVLLAGASQSMGEVDAILRQLHPALFDDPRHEAIFRGMIGLREDNHAVDSVMLAEYLKEQKTLDAAGGLDYVSPLADAAASVVKFPDYLRVLQGQHIKRLARLKLLKLNGLAEAGELDLEQIRAEFEEVNARITSRSTPMLDIISRDEAVKFVASPADYLVGDGLIMRDMVVTLVGDSGVGKSRLLTTLAAAGARGNGLWQPFPVRSKWRSLILQTENSGNRLKEEFLSVPEKLGDSIRVSRSLSHGLAFQDHNFCRELRAYYDRWPFQMLGIDPWNDVATDTGQKDYKEALLNIKGVFRDVKPKPCIVIVAHMRKAGRDDSGARKTGRELLAMISGSLALGSTSRTVFSVQPATNDPADDRVVFEVAKSNDVDPAYYAKYPSRTAWHRQNGAFAPCRDFDWEEWETGTAGAARRSIDSEMLQTVMKPREWIRPAVLAKAVAEKHNIGQSTVFRAVGPSGYLANLFDRENGLIRLREEAA